ncbi:MAG: arginase family protein, partial [Pyrinomonadaceae bacterium]
MEFSHLISPPPADVFFRRDDSNDPRLGETVSQANYEKSGVVILGCPQDEGVRRNGGRTGAAGAPRKIREQFYKFTNFGVNCRIYDAGDTLIADTLEAIHDNHTQIVKQILSDGKKLICLGGGNDLSYADGCAMSETYGAQNWTAFNIDAHFDVRLAAIRNSGTPYRQLLDEKLIYPSNFFEMGNQAHANSPVYFKYLKKIGVGIFTLEKLLATDIVELFAKLIEK